MDVDAKLAKKLYNHQAIEYSRRHNADVSTLMGRKAAYSLVGNLKNKKVLFSGCGDGLECLPAVKQGAVVVGIDISDKLIRLAKTNCPVAKFYTRDLSDTRLPEKQFDVIFSFLAVMYKNSLTDVLMEFRRLLKPQGQIIILVPHPIRKMIKYNKGDYFMRGKHMEIWHGTKRFNYYRLFEDYIQGINSAGLKLIGLAEPHPVVKKQAIIADNLYPHLVIFQIVKA